VEQSNGSGNDAATGEVIGTTSDGETTSLDGAAGAALDDPLADRPELLIGAAFLGGVLLAGMVSRFGR
jgi:hypothetical protein